MQTTLPEKKTLPIKTTSFSTYLILALAAGSLLLGGLLIIATANTWLPQLTQTLQGDQPHAYWYISRASGVCAYLLLWLSMFFGLLLSNRMTQLWLGGATAYDLHEYTSLLGLGFIGIHLLILLGDHYTQPSIWQLLLPFGMSGYQQIWVGLGQISFYLLVLVTVTFYIRKRLPGQLWRAVHYASFGAYGMALWHSVASGSDSSNPVLVSLYIGSALSLVIMFVYRILEARKPAKAQR